MKKLLYGGILVGLIACNDTVENSATALKPESYVKSVVIPKVEEGFKAYENDKTWIMYPNDWRVDEENAEEMEYFIYSPLSEGDNFQENVNLTAEKLPNNSITTEFYVQKALETVSRSISNFKTLENKEHKGNFGSFRTVIYTGNMGEMAIKWKQSIYIKNSTAYIISYTSLTDTYDSYDAITTKMMKSFIVK